MKTNYTIILIILLMFGVVGVIGYSYYRFVLPELVKTVTAVVPAIL